MGVDQAGHAVLAMIRHPANEIGEIMSTPTDRHYTDSHEWFLNSDSTITIGITQHAADELTDITFVEMLPEGTVVEAGGVLGEVESVKTTSEIFSAISGEIVEVNQAAADDPSLVNSDPYGSGWLVKIRTTDSSLLEGLMDGATYESKHA